MADSDEETTPSSDHPRVGPGMYTATMPSMSKPIHSGVLTKSPSKADATDPDKSSGFHQWRKRYFVLSPGGPQVCTLNLI
jgi:hypothetical protein